MTVPRMSPRHPRPTGLSPARASAGFTLMELLVVVALLSAVALAGFSAVAEDQGQVRFNDTRNRLERLRLATLGPAGPAWDGGWRLSGYAADNGRLPDSVADVIGTPAGHASQAAVEPAFDPQPDAQCAQDGGESALSWSATHRLLKGHRGDYLGGATVNGEYRDGFANRGATDDASNFGWVYATASDGFTLASLGADGVAGGTAAYDADQTLAIGAGDWRVDLNGWQVTVVNRSGADRTAADPALRASLLWFRNDASGGKWYRVTTQAYSGCLDGTGDGLVGGVPCADRVQLAFDADCDPDTATPDSEVPMGRHLVVLLSDADGSAHSSDDTVLTAGGAPITAQVALFPGADRPAVTLELR